jgi:hypothetical protein
MRNKGGVDAEKMYVLLPLAIVTSSLSQQEPLNRQAQFVQNSDTIKALFNKDDEHSDIYPSIPQLFARYLTKGQ